MIYFTGDMHGDKRRFGAWRLRWLGQKDALVVCGDFGFLWNGSQEEKEVLDWIGRRRYPVLFVEGTHDNLDLLSRYPVEEWNGGLVHHICGNLRHLIRGQVFRLQDKTLLALGGGESRDAAFRRAGDYFARMDKTRESVLSALTYPAFVIVVAIVIISIIMGYAVPTFLNMFDSMSIELPWVTRALIAVSGFFQRYALVLLGLLALGLLGLRLYAATEKGGPAMARAQLHIPILGNIARMGGASQFAHTMSMLLAAGMPILQAIETSGRTMTNAWMSGEVLDTLPGVEGGRSLGECLGHAKELPQMLVQMAAVGETTGSLEATLQVLAEYYDNEVDLRVKRALALLEPAIIVVLAIFVVFILMAVYLPMFSMYAAI